MDYSLKTISIGAGGGDLNFEGLRGHFFQADYTFCHSSGAYPGMYSGAYPGMYSGAYPGMYSGAYPGMYSGAYSGMYSGAYPGMYSGA